MKELEPLGQTVPQAAWRFVCRDHLALERETLLFMVVSLLDFLMTWQLLNHQSAGGQVWFVESNPIARYFLYSWGFDGLVAFKMGAVAFVAVICQVIARHKLDVARRLLHFATLAVMLVVVYSVYLHFTNT